MQEIEHGSQLPHRPEAPSRQLRRRRRRNQRRHDLTAAAALQRRLIAVPAAAVVIAVAPPAIPLVLLPRRRLGLAVLNRRLGGRVDPRGGADGARAGRAVAPGERRPRRRRGVVGRCGGGAVGGVDTVFTIIHMHHHKIQTKHSS